MRDQNPSRFGFFWKPAVALAVIAYALDEFNADGIIVFTRYGDANCYLADERLRPIWKELDARKAVVLVHPCAPADKLPLPHTLQIPGTEFPHETTRTTVDLIMSNTKWDHPNCKVILSHAGGTLPYLIGRVSISAYVGFLTSKSEDEIVADAKPFYFDIALSSNASVLNMLLSLCRMIIYSTEATFHMVPERDFWR